MNLDSETFMQLLSSREKVLSTLLSDLESCTQNMEAFEKLVALHESSAPVDSDKALRACAKSLRHVNSVNRRTLMLLLVYASGDNFTSDTAKILVKMGRGQEALREMFKQKMKG